MTLTVKPAEVTGGHVVQTGPISGTVTLPDGRVIDVTPDHIEVDSILTALAVSDAIGERHAAEGHPRHDADDPFVHIPSSLTHNTDGTPSKKFADTVAAHVAAGKDSSPAAILATLTKKV